MRLKYKAAVAVMAAAALMGGSTATATAATAGPAAQASCGWGAPLGASYWPNVSDPEYWLSYNSCNGTARGGMIVRDLEVLGNHGWHLWVYNEDTKAQQNLYLSYFQADQSYYTYTIGTSGTRSHVCLQLYDLTTKAGYGDKHCTGYYEGEIIT